MDTPFLAQNALLGVGLAMDAFSVSLANGLREPNMNGGRMTRIAGVYGIFQYLMPLLGWVCVHTIVEKFTSFEKYIPWIALALLGYIGGTMLVEGIRKKQADTHETGSVLGFGTLLVQGVATSIDALSVGFTIEQYQFQMALTASLIIAAVTHGICLCGLAIGRKFGLKLTNKASILGGLILIGIGLEILIKSFF